MESWPRTMRQEFLAGPDSFISGAHQAYCYDFVSDWLHSEDSRDIHEIAEYVEAELRLSLRWIIHRLRLKTSVSKKSLCPTL